ncbi:hypothetical protein RFI_06387 [Reticulomyxa filosa]|uniref:PH domain-containing protein n=1 Tax=Reticulomyxa filosa TaxID=46433 RepID=X6NY28_RETFI|nr:hypothetical protein RFI_06387 [Reticulomyxa filosa]|eukprot:ETO30739.1 hypothetical protein RFI_06387 [Reticulomyxa filosa]
MTMENAVMEPLTLEFEAAKTSFTHEVVVKEPEFESYKIHHEQENTLVPAKDMMEFSSEKLSLELEPLPKKVVIVKPKPKPKPIELVADDLVKTGTQFASILEKFKEKEFEIIGGSQQKRRMSQTIITKLAEQAKPAPLSPIISTPVRHSTLALPNKKFRTLKPRWAGYLTVVKSTIIPDGILEKHEKFYFCLDGLPRGTNNRTNESDEVKNRNGEPLIPSLFFFETEEDFKALLKESGNIGAGIVMCNLFFYTGSLPTRHLAFQKSFARFCRGVFQLDTRAVDKDQIKCVEKLKKLVRRKKSLAPPMLKRELGKPEQLFYCIGPHEHTVLKAPNQYTRDKWLEKVDYLVEKRVRPLARHKITMVEEDMD